MSLPVIDARDTSLVVSPTDGTAYVWSSVLRDAADTARIKTDIETLERRRNVEKDLIGPGFDLDAYNATIQTAQGMLGQYNFGSAVRAFMDGNADWLRESAALTEIYMDLNPKEVQFTPRESRTTEFKTNTGTRFMHWIGPDGRSEDLFSLVGKGSSGALRAPELDIDATKGLRPGQGVLVRRAYEIAQQNAKNRFLNWLSLFLLSTEPKVLPGTNIENEIRLTCSHQGFSAGLTGLDGIEGLGDAVGPVTFYGHFVRPMSFTDSAQSPFALEYSFEFLVHRFETLRGSSARSGWDMLSASANAAWPKAGGG